MTMVMELMHHGNNNDNGNGTNAHRVKKFMVNRLKM